MYVGLFVQGTGDPYNGMVTNEEWPTYGVGFRVSQGIQPEGRVGFAWDITGSGRTSLHGSLGRYHNAFVNANGLDVLARQPPAQNNPVLRYATIALLQTPEARAAFDTTPSNVTGFQHNALTPQSLNYSIGVQRELGWGTVLGVYLGAQLLASCFLVATILGTHWADVAFFEAPADGLLPHTWHEHAFHTAIDWHSPGWLRPLIHSTRPLDDAAEAHRLLEGRETTGKLVLTVGGR